MSNIVAQLCEARRAAGVSQTEMARRLGTTQSAVSRLEASTSARLDTVDRYAATLGCQVTVTRPSPLLDAASGVRAALERDDPESAFRAVVQMHDDLQRRHDVGSALNVEPGHTGDARWDAMIAGVVERMAHQSGSTVPGWTAAPSRRLDVLWFPIADILGREIGPALAGHLLASAPPELATRGVFVDPSSFESL